MPMNHMSTTEMMLTSVANMGLMAVRLVSDLNRKTDPITAETIAGTSQYHCLNFRSAKKNGTTPIASRIKAHRRIWQVIHGISGEEYGKERANFQDTGTRGEQCQHPQDDSDRQDQISHIWIKQEVHFDFFLPRI